MIQVSDEVTFLRADCACSMLVSRAQVQHSPHKGNCSLERSQHTHLFFFCQPGGRDKTSALKRLLAGGDRRRASPAPFRGVIFCICNQRRWRQPGLPHCRPATQTAAAVSRDRLRGATNLIGVLKMRRKEEFTAAAFSQQTVRLSPSSRQWTCLCHRCF